MIARTEVNNFTYIPRTSRHAWIAKDAAPRITGMRVHTATRKPTVADCRDGRWAKAPYGILRVDPTIVSRVCGPNQSGVAIEIATRWDVGGRGIGLPWLELRKGLSEHF